MSIRQPRAVRKPDMPVARIWLVAVMCAWGATGSAPATAAAGDGAMLLLHLQRGAQDLEASVLNDHDLCVVPGTPRLQAHGWLRVRSCSGLNSDQVRGRLVADPRVAAAVVDGQTRGASPNDPYYSRQWNLAALSVPAAWAAGVTGNGVTVALLDTGLSPGPDLADVRVLSGYDFVNNDADPADDHQHGTFVASVIASAVDNGVSIAGIAPDVILLPVKVLDGSAVGTTSALVEGLYFAAEQGAEVVNLSLAYAPEFYPGPVLDEALAELSALGITVVAAAGNHGAAMVAYPASHPAVLSVGATQRGLNGSDVIPAGYSNRGSALDVLAPGGASMDADGDGDIDGILGETFAPDQPAAYGAWYSVGTSGAAAQVSAVLASLISAGATPELARAIIEASAVDMGFAGFDALTGCGHVSLGRAIAMLRSGTSPPAAAFAPSVRLSERRRAGRWTAQATVAVTDATGEAAEGVWVYGHFVGAVADSFGLKTNGHGRVSFSSSPYDSTARESSGVRFLVDRVTAVGSPYRSSLRPGTPWPRHPANPDAEEQLKELVSWLRTDEGQAWLSSPAGQAWLMTEVGLWWLSHTHAAREWLLSEAGLAWLSTADGLAWILSPAGSAFLQSHFAMAWLSSPAGQAWLSSPAGQAFLSSPAGQAWLSSPAGQSWLSSPAGQAWLSSPAGQAWQLAAWLATEDGQAWLSSPAGQAWLSSPAGQAWLSSPAGQAWLSSPAGQAWLSSPAGQAWLSSPAGQAWLSSPAGQGWLSSPAGQGWLSSPAGQLWLEGTAGQRWLSSPAGQAWMSSPAGQAWVLSPAGQAWMWSAWLATAEGELWLSSPAGQAWLGQPAAQLWLGLAAGSGH
ncbi:MAG: S8 family serine peptidase [Candidatus Schekmanbacteria bacterium]|nr:S8 family serine peptidase [Candidatus Schekmanbacteria bacterium]